ncbi:hypothetical protein Lepto7375DRAFT_5517 [Leptolyngbya sp. PCC 7375]|nr:hypothetical protein Lepto7375DRAFT_5517 [Leptolyngbya sp. PCC 7375]
MKTKNLRPRLNAPVDRTNVVSIFKGQNGVSPSIKRTHACRNAVYECQTIGHWPACDYVRKHCL